MALVIAAKSKVGLRHSTSRPAVKATRAVSPATRISGTPSPVRSAIVGGPPQKVVIESGPMGGWMGTMRA